jgi:hypothetical protein
MLDTLNLDFGPNRYEKINTKTEYKDVKVLSDKWLYRCLLRMSKRFYKVHKYIICGWK